MAITHFDLTYFIWLGNQISWPKVKSFFDLGTQELNCNGHIEILEAYLKAIQPNKTISREDLELYSNDCFFRDIIKLADKDYHCYDIAGEGEFTLFDLNFDQVSSNFLEKFDFVTNCGTSEHVHNQYNCFSVMHALTKPGGYMYHCLPLAGFTGHGFYNYNPKFFYLLANSNGYELVDNFITVDNNVTKMDSGSLEIFNQDKPFLEPHGQDLAGVNELFCSTNTGIRVLLKKIKSSPFRPALDMLGQESAAGGVDKTGRVVGKTNENGSLLTKMSRRPKDALKKIFGISSE